MNIWKGQYYGRMKKHDNILREVIYKGILILMVYLLAVIFIGTVTTTQEKVFDRILTPSVKYALLALLTLTIGGVYIQLFRVMNRMKKRDLIILSVIMAMIMLCVHGILLMSLDPYSSSDAYNMQDMALYLAKTGVHQVTGDAPHAEYYGYYSNNYFLTIVLSKYMKLMLALGIADMYKPLHILGTASVLVTTLFLYLTGVRVAGMKGGAGVLAFCVGNPLYYLMSFWLYSNTCSLPFTAGVVYFAVRLFYEKNRTDRIISSVLLAVFAIVGYFIRATAAIPLIAFVLCYAVEWIAGKRNVRQAVQSMVILTLVGIVLAYGINTWNQSYFAQISDQNIPVTHWIMMASHGTGKYNKEDLDYTTSFETKEEKKEATLEKIKENYESYTPGELKEFLHRKLLTSWCFADGGDLRSRLCQDRKYTRVYTWLMGDKSETFRMYCYAFRLACLGLIIAGFWSLIRKKGMPVYPVFYAVAMLGGICFYSFWEVKNTYGMPFVMMLLLLGAYGTQCIVPEKADIEYQDSQIAFSWKKAVLLVTAVSISVISVNQMHHAQSRYRDWTVRCTSRMTRENIGYTDQLNVEQTFYASKPFNRIGVEMKYKTENPTPDDTVTMILLDDEQQEVYRERIPADQIKDDKMFYLKMPLVVPEKKNTMYTLVIWNEKPLKGKMTMNRRAEGYLGGYEGILTSDGKPIVGRLYLRVFYRKKGVWCSAKAAIFMAGVISMVAGTVILTWPRRRKL